MYALRFTEAVRKELSALENKKKRQIMERILGLAANPRPAGCRELQGYDLFRLRSGIFRIVYQIQNKALLVLILRVAPRKNVYKRLPDV